MAENKENDLAWVQAAAWTTRLTRPGVGTFNKLVEQNTMLQDQNTMQQRRLDETLSTLDEALSTIKTQKRTIKEQNRTIKKQKREAMRIEREELPTADVRAPCTTLRVVLGYATPTLLRRRLLRRSHHNAKAVG